MNKTGKFVTEEQSRHFNSIARHIQPIAHSIEADMNVCQNADWEGLDQAYINGKLADLNSDIASIQRVLRDMLPALFPDESVPHV